ncbi:MAG: ComF family protein [Liquorilactobacillus ghanensis]|uniref:ComF family protein n=1 Tax=Liquorilactobacillus ghanensis TaxID=399370 RepID=UPI0039EB0515
MHCLKCQRLIQNKSLLKWFFSWTPIEQENLCAVCRADFLSLKSESICSGCGRFQTTPELCSDCHEWQQKITGDLLKNRALYCYNQAMKDYFLNYKFHGNYQWRLFFQSAIAKEVGKFTHQGWLAVPIPISDQTWQQRGFNQVEGLLEKVSFKRLLKIKANSDKGVQSKRNRQQRLKMPQPFELNDKIQVNDKKILLIDDVYTTGRTLYHARSLMLAAGAANVKSLTLAR